MTLRTALLCTALLLAGCGVETATTAATAVKLKAQETEASDNAKDDIQNKIDAALAKEQVRLELADKNAQ